MSPEPVDAPVRPRLAPWFGVGVRTDALATVGPLFGATLEGGVVRRRQWGWGGWSFTGQLRWAPKQTGIGLPSTSATVDVSSALVAGSLLGCVHRAWPVTLAGCVVTELGEVQQSAGTSLPPNLHQTVSFAGGGLGARVEVPIVDRVYVDMAADVRGVAVLAGDTTAWKDVQARTFAGPAGSVSAGVGVSF